MMKPSGHEREGPKDDEENQGKPGAGDVNAKDEIGNEYDKQCLGSVEHQTCRDLGRDEGGGFQSRPLHPAEDSPFTPGRDLSCDSVHIVAHDHHGDDSWDKEIHIANVQCFNPDFFNRHDRLVVDKVFAVLINDSVHNRQAKLCGREVLLVIVNRKGEGFILVLHVFLISFRDFDQKLDVTVFHGFFSRF